MMRMMAGVGIMLARLLASWQVPRHLATEIVALGGGWEILYLLKIRCEGRH